MSTKTEEPPAFDSLGLHTSVLSAVKELGYESPSPIQAAAIPPFLEGKDILGQAQTGTGKTAAFALPLLTSVDLSLFQPQVLVLAPTRELAIQVALGPQLMLTEGWNSPRVARVYERARALAVGRDSVEGFQALWGQWLYNVALEGFGQTDEICDLLLEKGLGPVGRVKLGSEMTRRLTDGLGTEACPGSVAGAGVERHAQDGHVAARHVTQFRQSREGRGARIAGHCGSADRLYGLVLGV